MHRVPAAMPELEKLSMLIRKNQLINRKVISMFTSARSSEQNWLSGIRNMRSIVRSIRFIMYLKSGKKKMSTYLSNCKIY